MNLPLVSVNQVESDAEDRSQTRFEGSVEEFVISGDEVVAKIKELMHKGNIRRISLQTEEGKTLRHKRAS